MTITIRTLITTICPGVYCANCRFPFGGAERFASCDGRGYHNPGCKRMLNVLDAQADTNRPAAIEPSDAVGFTGTVGSDPNLPGASLASNP